MSQRIFNSKFPILEAAMNRGSTLPLALAVHAAGGYPSFCGWTYEKNWNLMRSVVGEFIEKSGSNNVHLMFELEEISLDPTPVMQMIYDYKISTVELLYGQRNKTFQELTFLYETINRPLAEKGVNLFRRCNVPQQLDWMKRQYLTGYCIKGHESAGVTGQWAVKDLVLEQKKLTPDAKLIPYGGVGTSDHVKEYIDIGVEIIAVGTLLAFSKESTVKEETKQKVLMSNFSNVTTDENNLNVKVKRNVLEFEKYTGPDTVNDSNRTASLLEGLYGGTNQGHIYIGKSIDHVVKILPVKEIIENLCSKI